ncbi:MAG TPA: sugar MFS transporter [Niabella sp.]
MNNQRLYVWALIALAVLYFMMGFVTVLNDSLVPYFKQGFSLNYTRSSLVQFYFYLTYGLISIPAGKLVMRTGYKQGMILGFLLAAMGALLFWPAATLHKYVLFLGALFVIAVGIVLLQVSANPYITALGSRETAASRLTLIQGIGSVGTTLAPVFGAHFILSGIGRSENSSHALIVPYLLIAGVLLLIAGVVWKLRLPVVHQASARAAYSLWRLLKQFPRLRFGVLALFLYVGAEVGIGTFLTNYTADQLQISEAKANYFVAYYWGGMLIGRLLGAFALRYVQASRLLLLLAAMATAAVLLSVNTEGMLSVVLLIGCGLCNSVMFASVFSLSVDGMGPYTGQASGILSTAIIGGAVLTYVQGYLKDHMGWPAAFCIPALAYIGIFAYARFAGKNKPE